MSIAKLEHATASTPSYTPSIATDYNNQNAYILRNARGYNAISLTNWDSGTTKPQIAAGSAIEINGATYAISTNTDIDTAAASAGTIYVYFDDGVPEFKFLDTAPTWSATLNGWYTSGDRFTGHLMTWDGASSYTVKSKYRSDEQDGDEITVGAAGELVAGDVSIEKLDVNDSSTWTGTYTAKAMAISENYVIPAGGYMMVAFGATVTLQVHSGSAWASTTYGPSGLIVSDGTNYRVSGGASGGSIYYRKFW